MVKGGKEREMSPWRQTNKQTTSENRASQIIDTGLLTFAKSKF